MGQELLDINPSYYFRSKTRYFLATTSTGLRVVRGSTSKSYSYACVAMQRSEWGWVTNLWSSREELAQRNAKSYNRYYKGTITFEVVKTQEITSKEARQIKKQLNKEIDDYQNNKQSTTTTEEN
jgi:hypothetical protein